MSVLFSVTYEVWSDDAVECGETDESGYIIRDVRLRDAIDAVRETRTNEVDGATIEPSCSDIASARWITVCNGREFRTGDQESRSIHFPVSLTGATRARIARLMGVK